MFDAPKLISQNNDWISWVFLSILILLAIVKLVFNKRLDDTNKFFFSKKYLYLYFNKQKRLVFNWYQILLFIVQVLTLSLLFYLTATILNLNFEYGNFMLFSVIAISILSYFSVRYLIGLFLAFVLSLKPGHTKLLYEKISYFNNLTLWILPIVLLLAYSQFNKEILLNIVVSVFIILLAIRYILLLINNKKLIFSDLLYFILYLCTLEIAPLVIILKITI